jgi:hypothetical protein
MIISIIQPVYLPWLGYFEQMAYADHFVFMDDVQYTRHDWRNRNRIKTTTGPIWLTVPVKAHPRTALISAIEISYDSPWPTKHLRSIEQNYGKCAYFRPLFDDLSSELEKRPAKLLELDRSLTLLLARYLDVRAPTSLSSQVARGQSAGESKPGDVDKNDRIIEICRHHGATLLYDGAKAAEFIDVDLFRRTGIEVVFQDYRHPVYRQAFGDFISHQSAIDLIMNTGREAGEILRSSPVPERIREMRRESGSRAGH